MEKVLIVFDFDGTLVDSAMQIKNRVVPSYYERKLPMEACTEEIRDEITKNYGKRGKYNYGIVRNGKELTEEEQGKVVGEIMELLGVLRSDKDNPLKFEFFDGMKELLKDIVEKYYNVCDLAVCSASEKNDIEKALQENGLKNLFKTIISEQQLAIKKPDPKLLEQAIIETRGNYKKIIVVGDTSNDINLLKKFRDKHKNYDTKIIAVSYGSFQPKKYLEECQPDIMVDSVEGLYKNLVSQLKGF